MALPPSSCSKVLAFLLCLLLGEFNQQASASVSASKMRLTQDLFMRYNTKVMPSEEINKPVTIKVGVSLIDILEAKEDKNELELLAWVSFEWRDSRLQWNPEIYNNLTSLKVSTELLWNPDLDIVVYEQTSAAEMIYPDINAVVFHQGTVTYIPSKKYRVSCVLSGLESVEGATCMLRMGSWTHDGLEIDLQPKMIEIGLTNYFTGSKFEVVSSKVQRNEMVYPCCPTPYVDLQYTFAFRNKAYKKPMSLFSSFF